MCSSRVVDWDDSIRRESTADGRVRRDASDYTGGGAGTTEQPREHAGPSREHSVGEPPERPTPAQPVVAWRTGLGGDEVPGEGPHASLRDGGCSWPRTSGRLPGGRIPCRRARRRSGTVRWLRRNKVVLGVCSVILTAVVVVAGSIGGAARDRSARQTEMNLDVRLGTRRVTRSATAPRSSGPVAGRRKLVGGSGGGRAGRAIGGATRQRPTSASDWTGS